MVGKAMCDQFQAEQLETELAAGAVVRDRRDQSVTTWRLLGAPSWELDDDQTLGRRLTVEAVPSDG